jgi:hypothetical protein
MSLYCPFEGISYKLLRDDFVFASREGVKCYPALLRILEEHA